MGHPPISFSKRFLHHHHSLLGKVAATRNLKEMLASKEKTHNIKPVHRKYITIRLKLNSSAFSSEALPLDSLH